MDDYTRLIAACASPADLTADIAGQLVDAYKGALGHRLACDKIAEAAKVKEVELKNALIFAIKHLNISAVGGRAFVCSHTITKEPTVTSWPDFQAYVLETKDFSLLEKRPGRAAIKERWEDGKEVPGVGSYDVDKLSFTKVKGT